MVNKDACFDIPDERDYHYQELLWANKTLPWEFEIDLINDYQNQWLEDITKYMCVFFSTTHWVNIWNYLEWWNEILKWKDLWLRALELWRLDLKKWAAIQHWPLTARDEKYISSWYLVDENNIKQALFDWNPVVVGSNSLIWNKTTPEAGKSYWHAVLIIGWNQYWYIIKESYWKSKRDNWRQYLPYDLFGNLYTSKYALVDEPSILTLYIKKIMENINIEKAKEAFTLWLWNGLDATKPASREEVATMILRWLEKLKNWDI